MPSISGIPSDTDESLTLEIDGLSGGVSSIRASDPARTTKPPSTSRPRALRPVLLEDGPLLLVLPDGSAAGTGYHVPSVNK